MYNINELISQIQNDLGAAPQNIQKGKVNRFDIGKKGNKAGWATLDEWNFNGKEYAASFYGDWRKHSNIEHLSWKSWSKEEELKNKGILKTFKNARETIEREQKELDEEKLKVLREKFKEFVPAYKENDYALKKQMKNHLQLFEDKYGNLILPAYKNVLRSEIYGFQTVSEIGKFFASGSQARGAFNYFGHISEETKFIYICEGIATADSIYHATGVPTVSCFSAGNIPNVIRYFKHDFSGINIIIACDQDKNEASMRFAMKAKAKFGNIEVLKPKFPKGSTLSDFNDLFLSEGFDAVKKQLEFDETKFSQIELLGYKEGNYFFYSSETQEINSYTFEKMKNGSLITMAPNKYWAQKYVPIIKEDEPTERCNWLLTTENIIENQNRNKKFSIESIRGVGSWKDGDHLVLNLGDKLLVDYKNTSFGKHRKLKKMYQPNDGRIIKFEKKDSYDFSRLVEAIDLIDFASDRDRIITLGYIAIAQIFTTQRWRPHMWLTAEKGTGKSSVLEFLNMVIQNSKRFQDSTAAGLRQEIKTDSMVCIIDEAEGESSKTRQLVELARQASSGTGTSIARGTPTGNGFTFKPEMTFVFASIRLPDLTPADKSRNFLVFMKKRPKNDFETNQKRDSAIYDASKLGVDIFSYMNTHIDEFEKTLEETKEEMKKSGFDNRYIDQMAPVFVGYMMLNPSADSEWVAKTLCAPDVENQDDEEVSDQYRFYADLMNTIIKDGSTERTIEQFLSECQNNRNVVEGLNQILSRYGITYLPKKKTLFFRKNNNMNNLMSKTTKFKNYFEQMRNNKHFQTNVQQRLGSQRKKGTLLVCHLGD